MVTSAVEGAVKQVIKKRDQISTSLDDDLARIKAGESEITFEFSLQKFFHTYRMKFFKKRSDERYDAIRNLDFDLYQEIYDSLQAQFKEESVEELLTEFSEKSGFGIDDLREYNYFKIPEGDQKYFIYGMDPNPEITDSDLRRTVWKASANMVLQGLTLQLADKDIGESIQNFYLIDNVNMTGGVSFYDLTYSAHMQNLVIAFSDTEKGTSLAEAEFDRKAREFALSSVQAELGNEFETLSADETQAQLELIKEVAYEMLDDMAMSLLS